MKLLTYIMNHFAMAPAIVFDAILRHCEYIIKNEDKILAQEEKLKAQGKMSWCNPVALIRDAKAIKKYLEKK